jgi:hypothetical protein
MRRQSTLVTGEQQRLAFSTALLSKTTETTMRTGQNNFGMKIIL